MTRGLYPDGNLPMYTEWLNPNGTNPYHHMTPRTSVMGESVMGMSDITLPGMLIPPLGLAQLFSTPTGPFSKAGKTSSGGASGDWSGVLKVGALVGVSLLGYFVISHLFVASKSARGAFSGAKEVYAGGGEDE
jgi:hypothetical protein